MLNQKLLRPTRYEQRVAKKDWKCKCCGTNGFVYIEELDEFLCYPRYQELLLKRRSFLRRRRLVAAAPTLTQGTREKG